MPGSLLRKTSVILLVLLFLFSFTAVFGWFRLNRAISQSHAHRAADKAITIEPRTSTATIIRQLEREGILAGQWPTWWWMKTVARRSSFKSGTYEFKSPITPLEVINKLTKGEVATRTLTIPEGFTQWDIAAKLAAPLPGMKEPPPDNQQEILDLMKRRVDLVTDLDAQAATLEGYLFPDTYEYTVTTTREQLLEMMVKRFRKVWTTDLQQKAAALGMTVRQAVTMASLVEKEARVDSERETISQVYHRRWKEGIKLDCDPTVLYASWLAGKQDRIVHQSDLDRDSPYNTYRRAGLPPGPVASPGKRSIEAALNPAQTRYLFFVRDGNKNDGSHVFSETSGDHERAVAVYRQWERQQGAQKDAQPAATTSQQ